MIRSFFHNTKLIRKFESELHLAQNKGFITCLTHVKRPKMPSAIPEVVGIEIFFSDHVSDNKIAKMKEYIEYQYKFSFDMSTYMEKGKWPKIVYVEYM